MMKPAIAERRRAGAAAPSLSTGRRQAGGYTLIELLIVMVILSLLAALFIPQWHAVVDRNHVRAAKGIGRQLQVAMEVYKFNEDSYPSAIADTDVLYQLFQNHFSFDFRRELSQDKFVGYQVSGTPPSDYTLAVKANVSAPTLITITPRAVSVVFNGEKL